MHLQELMVGDPGDQDQCAASSRLAHPAGHGPQVEVVFDVDHGEALHHRRVRVHAEGLRAARPQVCVEARTCEMPDDRRSASHRLLEVVARFIGGLAQIEEDQRT